MAKIFICLPTPDYPGRWRISGKTIHDEMIPTIWQVARETDVRVIDPYTASHGHKDLFPNTVHPNAVGAGIMAAIVCRELTGKLPPSDKLREGT